MSSIFRRWKRLSDREDHVDDAALQDGQWDGGMLLEDDDAEPHHPTSNAPPRQVAASAVAARTSVGHPAMAASSTRAPADSSGPATYQASRSTNERHRLVDEYPTYDSVLPRASPLQPGENIANQRRASTSNKTTVKAPVTSAVASQPAAPPSSANNLQPLPSETDQQYAERLQRMFDEEYQRERQRRVELDAQLAASLARQPQ